MAVMPMCWSVPPIKPNLKGFAQLLLEREPVLQGLAGVFRLEKRVLVQF